jgi:hypothetical protein
MFINSGGFAAGIIGVLLGVIAVTGAILSIFKIFEPQSAPTYSKH